MPPLQGNFINTGAGVFIAGLGPSIQDMRATPTYTIVGGTAGIHVSNQANYNAVSLTDVSTSYIRVNTNTSPAANQPGHFYENVITLSAEL